MEALCFKTFVTVFVYDQTGGVSEETDFTLGQGDDPAEVLLSAGFELRSDWYRVDGVKRATVECADF